uniref:uncharacterized protein LOC105352026 n=1 Tax=Fragaria vesca subsp. vesca TaxID=101020 RepID=UPI0005CA32C5|nr:PREDICTED: uncharacterized protein LOC105352026 [Fragaria vesca subsp. vesca]
MDVILASATDDDDDEDVEGIMHLTGFVEMRGVGKLDRTTEYDHVPMIRSYSQREVRCCLGFAASSLLECSRRLPKLGESNTLPEYISSLRRLLCEFLFGDQVDDMG